MGESTYVLSLVASLSPILVVALVGVILGLANLRRVGGAAMMALLGSGLIGLTVFVTLVARIVLWQQLREGGLPVDRFNQIMMLVGIVSSVGYAMGLALVVVAVFVGRTAKPTPTAIADEEV